MSSIKAALFVLFLLGAQAAIFKRHPLSENEPNDSGVLQWFDQLLDHSNPADKTTWKQRFFVYDKFFNPSEGLVILYLCGEWTCDGLGSATFALTLAEKFQGIVFAVEHRFFGESQPLGYGEDAQTTESFAKYLNVHQALDDLAYFITKTKSNQDFGISSANPWITIGGSYPGALSAWFRYKYPHLTIGSLASSAVVQAKQDYYEYDMQVEVSTSKSGDWCPTTIAIVQSVIDRLLREEQTNKELKNEFGASDLNDGEFSYFFADITAGFIQTGKRTQLCDSLKDKTLSEAVQVLRNYSKTLDVDGYKTEALQNTTYNRNNNSRQWMFQTCSELGYWQTKGTELRSPLLTVDFYQQWCEDIFGQTPEGNYYWADTSITNGYFGGADIDVKNLIMTNGAEDPWKHASIYQKRPDSQIHVIHIDCDNCAHCVDTKAPKDTDAEPLKEARKQITELFEKWYKEHWEKVSKESIQYI